MTWKEVLSPVLNSFEIIETKKFLKQQRETVNIYPEGKNVFRAFDLCPFEKTKVVIIGSEPYNTPGTSDGLAFSSKQKERPKVLEVIFKEIYRNLNIQYSHNLEFDDFFPTNNLEKWAQNGFLLLNTSLTSEEGKTNAHKYKWDSIIEAIFSALNKKNHQVIFLLWGDEAKKLSKLIGKKTKHVYFEAEHPSVELYQGGNNGFYRCNHFSIVRDILPAINGINLFEDINLTHCFDKDQAKKIAKNNYPKEEKRISDYIDKELIIHVPVNKEFYWEEIRKFELLMSTKY